MCFRISIHRQSGRIAVSLASPEEFEREDIFIKTKRDLIAELTKAGMRQAEIDSHLSRLKEERTKGMNRTKRHVISHIQRAKCLAGKILTRECTPGETASVAQRVLTELEFAIEGIMQSIKR